MRTLWEAFSAIAAAVGALATFGAVLEALIPVWTDSWRRRTFAKTLRVLLFSKLGPLRPSI